MIGITPIRGRRRSQSIEVVGEDAIVMFGRGLRTIIDARDLPLVQDLCFTKMTRKSGVNAVAVTGYKSQYVTLARFLLRPPTHMVVDHIDGDTLNNRRSNLRICSRAQNAWNMAAQRKKMGSRFKGVSLNGTKTRFRAQIITGGKAKYLGTFDAEVDAARAYDSAARATFGEFACLNFAERGEQCVHRGSR